MGTSTGWVMTKQQGQQARQGQHVAKEERIERSRQKASNVVLKPLLQSTYNCHQTTCV